MQVNAEIHNYHGERVNFAIQRIAIKTKVEKVW